MGQHQLKMYFGHTGNVKKLTFRVRSEEGLMLERLSQYSSNGGQFTSLVQLRKSN